LRYTPSESVRQKKRIPRKVGRFHKAASGVDHIERLGRGESCIHRLSPASKAFVTMLFICFVVSVPGIRPGALIPFAFYPAVLMPLSGTPASPILSRVRFALPFALFAGASNLIFMRETAFTLGALSVSFGMLSFFSIMLKTVFSVCAVLILIATTPFTLLAECLTSPRFFRPLGLQLALSYRYISVLLDEAEALWTAYSLRYPGCKAVDIKDFGSFLGQLLLRSFDRAQRVYDAMRCRGFSGVYCAGVRPGQKWSGLVFAAVCACAFAVIRFVPIAQIAGKLL
jgi:cobalt/nickel transport system permease protein